MDKEKLKNLLSNIRNGQVSVDDAMDKLRNLPFEDLGFAKVDHHRSLRKGFPEVIFCPGKTSSQVVDITGCLYSSGSTVLITRADESVFNDLKNVYPEAKFHEIPRAIVLYPQGFIKEKGAGNVVVMSAGTADLPVAEEAALTAALMGCNVTKLYDVGVAGIHRLLEHLSLLEEAKAIVVVAGMEGALPSVVGGLVGRPIISVPTSVGYGAHFGGVAPLLTMLNTCATGIAVVNIDNGFGAGYMAALINLQSK